ncbi:BPL-N domain-containing protein [Blastopirellula retiformator]|uniref:Biotin-protein ligase N-terminal domain-containing protein n=1 Tax=Blastopirellula retiformator TaxID=2527970 RepID=A0A5C5V950_9BACT|nr:BPL-N domain-containing protein [Blastopirellula retiformator]TWT34379.1 hypothetical protein Enr8_17870 [Blastopirellula retiformator]
MTDRFLQRLSLRLVVGLALLMAAAPAIAQAEKKGAASTDLIRVALYSHADVESKTSGPSNLQRFLSPENGFETAIVSPEDIRGGVLKNFDVLIMPGGMGSSQAKHLEESGCETVKNFVREGGGYVGICAGSYLASSHYTWSLGIINAKVWDRAHWARGTGKVSLGLTSAGQEVLQSEKAKLDCYYGQGPLLVPHNSPDLPGYEVLATYETEIAKKGAPEGAMVGTHAIVRTTYGGGRVMCFSPHPEKPGGPNAIMMEGIRWVGSNR